MKAIVYHRFGSPDMLKLEEVEKPTPGDNELLVRVTTTTVTAGDTRMRSFTVPLSFWLPARIALGFRRPKLPILGMELAGEVEAVGRNVTRYRPGDRVFASTGEHGFGAYAEYKCLPQAGVVAKIVNGLSAEEAVTIPVGARTALYFLRAATILPGQKVLIYGASGSVGTFAVQLARYFGAEVTGVCSAANLELVRSLGAQRVIDYNATDFAANGARYDVVFDTVGKASLSACMRVLNQGGVYLQAVPAPGISLRMRWAAFTGGKRAVGGGPPPDVADMVYLRELMEEGHIRPVIDRRYRMDEIVEAHRYVDTGRKRGNVLVTVAGG